MGYQMNILLTNDDGVNAAGLGALYDVLSENHAVFIIAPDEERSACSNAITVRRNLRINTVSGNKYSVDGLPADCVNIGLNGGLLPEIDLVISGINHGPNLGDDVHFSGTVGGARTALIFGVTGIAVSLDCLGTSDYFIDTALFVREFIKDYKRIERISHICLNINYPDLPKSQVNGFKYTTLGKREYRDSYRMLSRNSETMQLQLNGTIHSVGREGSDVHELRNGYISITPLQLDCTDYTYLSRLPKAEESWLK